MPTGESWGDLLNSKGSAAPAEVPAVPQWLPLTAATGHPMDAAVMSWAFEHNPAGIAVVGNQGRILAANPALAAMLGYTPEELRLKTVPQISHPDDLQRELLDHVQRAEASGEQHPVYRMRKRYLRKDGTWLWGDLTAAMTRNVDGQILAVGIVIDLTEQIRREEEASRSRAFEQAASSIDTLGAWEWDMATDMFHHSDNWRRIHGVTSPSCSRDQLNKLAHPDDLPAIAKAFDAARLHGQPYHIEHRIIRQDTREVRIILAHGEVVFGEHGRPVRVCGLVCDVTEARQARRDLEERSALFAKLTAQVPGMVYQIRRWPDGRTAMPFASDAILDIFGLAADDVRDDASPLFQRVHPEDLSRVQENLRQSAADLSPFICEVRVQGPDQVMHWTLTKAAPERLPDGSTLWHGFGTDISEHKRVEEQLRLGEQRNREVAEHNRQLLREVNHRVKNNLASILSLITLSASRVTRVPDLAKALESRIIAMSRVHELLSQQQWSDLEFRLLAHEVLDVLGRGYSLGDRLRITGPDWPISPRRATSLALILQELFSNACKYGALSVPAGHIDLTWSFDQSGCRITWREFGGPSPAIPHGHGLGTDLIQGLARHDLRGECQLDFDPAGFSAHFVFQTSDAPVARGHAETAPTGPGSPAVDVLGF